VLLRDDKSFPFILLREDHPFPQDPQASRRPAIKGQYYGPFASAGSVNRGRSTRCRSCSCSGPAPTASGDRTRPCLLYQIKRCSAPCVGRIDEAGYAELVEEAKAFLAGKSTRCSEARASMSQAAEAMDFELAAVLRDRLRALTFIQGTQTIAAEGLGDADVFALACKGGQMPASRPSSSAAARIGGTALLSRAYQRRARGRGSGQLPHAILRGGAAAPDDPARPRGARGASCSPRRCPSGRSARSPSRVPSAATVAG
jgi:excinuclease UvrABC nuclease subunit